MVVHLPLGSASWEGSEGWTCPLPRPLLRSWQRHPDRPRDHISHMRGPAWLPGSESAPPWTACKTMRVLDPLMGSGPRSHNRDGVHRADCGVR